MKILVTGFKPFLGQQTNPSESLSKQMAESFSEVTSVVLPVEFEKSFEIINQLIEKHRYDYVILLGQAAERSHVCFEKIALNWIETDHKDEAGVLPMTGPIRNNIDLALMTSFPVDDIFNKLKKEHWPVKISFSAGTYVCNELYFRTLLAFKDAKSVFVHVPITLEQKKEDKDLFMPYDMQKEILIRLLQLLI